VHSEQTTHYFLKLGNLLLMLAAMAGSPLVNAEEHRQPTDAEVRAAAERFRTPTDLELSKIPTPSNPKLDIDVTPIDLNKLAKRFSTISLANPKDVGLAATLLVFVSLDMPKPSLTAIVAQAEAVGATLVLRGLKDRSIKKTAMAVTPLIGKRNVSWVIDPQPFTRFDIRAVPAYVLVRENTDARKSCSAKDAADSICAAPPVFVKVAGDVSIAYMLDVVRAESPNFRSDAESLLKKLGR